MTLPIKLEFLTSTRFWALIVGAIALYCKTKGFIGDSEMILIETIMGGFITIKTIDRAGEQIGGNTISKSSSM